MNKEQDHSRAFLSFLHEKTNNNPYFASIEDCPEAYNSLIPLIKRLQSINKDNLKPRTFQEAQALMPELRMVHHVYVNSLNQFIGFFLKEKGEEQELNNYSLREFLIIKMNKFFFNILTEDQRDIHNDAKHLIGGLYDDVYKNSEVSWTAVRAFQFGFFHHLTPDNKVFQIKPNPFLTSLNFYELGTKPQCFKSGETFVDIPVYNHETKSHFFACCSDKNDFLITHGHLQEEDCLNRKPLENGALIVNNKGNVQDKPGFYFTNRQQSTL